MPKMDTKAVLAKQATLIENWSERINLVEEFAGEEGLAFEKKAVLAQCLENTQLAIDMLESTDAGSTDGFKHFALDLVTAIVPNLVANDIVSIQPIDNEVGVINYIQYLYGSTKGAAVKGTEFASGILYTGSDIYYSSQEVVGEGLLAESGVISGTLAWKPLIKGTVNIPLTVKNASNVNFAIKVVDTAKDGTLIAVNAVSGEAISDIITDATINYESGALTFKLATGYTLVTDTVTAGYHYDQKSVGDGAIGTNALQVPEVDIKIATMPVICQSRKLKALYAFDAAFKLQKEYGSDINALLNSQIAAEIAHEIDGEIMQDLYVGAGLVNDTWNKTKPVGVPLRDHYESFFATVVVGSNKIFEATKRAQATFMIVGIDVASVVEVMPSFVSAGATNVIGPHICGTLGGITVIKNPYFEPKAYLLGYKGMSLFDAGYFYCPYMPVVTTQLVMLDDFVGRKGWATSYAKKMVQPLLYCKGEIVELPNTDEITVNGVNN